jgi:HSP20 family protein
MLTLYTPRVPALRPWFAPMRSLFEEVLPGFGEDAAVYPKVDITKEKDHYKLTAEFPGMSVEDVHVEVKDGSLTLWGEKKKEAEHEGNGYTCSERYYGSFSRSFCLPSDASMDNIEAKMDKGVLTVTIPVIEEKSKKIKVIEA